MGNLARRRMFLGLAFLGALTAAMMAPSEEVARVPKRAVGGQAVASPPVMNQRRAASEAEIPLLASFDRRIDEKFVVIDVFESRPLAGPAPARAPPAAAAAPQIPFTYMGRVEEAGRERFVFVEGEKLHVVAVGGQFASTYRLEEAGSEELVLNYLPLDIRQRLSIVERK